jgi:hypothetical protein
MRVHLIARHSATQLSGAQLRPCVTTLEHFPPNRTLVHQQAPVLVTNGGLTDPAHLVAGSVRDCNMHLLMCCCCRLGAEAVLPAMPGEVGGLTGVAVCAVSAHTHVNCTNSNSLLHQTPDSMLPLTQQYAWRAPCSVGRHCLPGSWSTRHADSPCYILACSTTPTAILTVGQCSQCRCSCIAPSIQLLGRAAERPWMSCSGAACEQQLNRYPAGASCPSVRSSHGSKGWCRCFRSCLTAELASLWCWSTTHVADQLPRPPPALIDR